jgi:hypothetical protein
MTFIRPWIFAGVGSICHFKLYHALDQMRYKNNERGELTTVDTFCGIISLVASITTPNVPPPPPRSAQNKSAF